MSDSSKRIKPASVAAFLFLPQFGKMFRSSSYIIPILIRMIANLFIQSGLLPPTHPAAAYGVPGVEKVGFFKLMGDAWYTVRSSSATTYQWSVFCSVLLMIFVFISSIIMTIVNLSTIFISSAAAQVFTGPLGPTDIASIPALQAPCVAGNAGTPFCRMIPANGTPHGDYAINILDQMLRLGANQTGGPLQNAVGALMQVYNAGILVVAGVLLFWLIISVVVDIARTGQVGGGRHNLVWAPIRIVFGLGLMIPLGASGYSSGQFMIMKIAEWGSNFGTNAWAAYLNVITANATVVPTLPMGDDVLPLVGNYTRMWVCRVAHNGYGYQAEGANFDQQTQEVYLHPDTGEPDRGMMSYAFTNNTAGDLCGRVSFPTQNSPQLQALINPPAGVTPDPVAVASAKFKQAVSQAWQNLFVNGYNAANSGAPNYTAAAPANWTAANGPQLEAGLPLAKLANNFACGFVAQHLWGQVNGQDVLNLDCGGGSQYNTVGAQAAPVCGSGAGGSGQYPDMSCVESAASESDTGTMAGTIWSAVNTATQQAIAQFGNINPTQIYGTRGWADMGNFYKGISTMTITVQGAFKIPVQISAPAIQDSSDNQSAKVMEVLGKYQDWWDTVPETMAPPAAPARIHHNGGGGILSDIFHVAKGATGSVVGAVGTVTHAGEEMISGAKAVTGMISNLASDPSGAFLKEVMKVVSDYEGTSFLAIPNANDPTTVNEYPLEIVSKVGSTLMAIALAIYGAVTALEITAAAVPSMAIGATLTTSMLGNLINIVGEVMMGCGAVLLFYLPLLPFIRVAHAVLTWMIAVFEAVMLVPIAALSFLDTEHEGMVNKLPFVNWLDVLVRPTLTVIGFVGSILVFDTFFAFFQDAFGSSVSSEVAGTNILFHFFAMFVNSCLFCLIMYTVANSCFKLLTEIPNAFFRWLPGGQQGGSSHIGEAGDYSGAVNKAGSMANSGAMKASGSSGRLSKGIQGKGEMENSRLSKALNKPGATPAGNND